LCAATRSHPGLGSELLSTTHGDAQTPEINRCNDSSRVSTTTVGRFGVNGAGLGLIEGSGPCGLVATGRLPSSLSCGFTLSLIKLIFELRGCVKKLLGVRLISAQAVTAEAAARGHPANPVVRGINHAIVISRNSYLHTTDHLC
jgi:hypothetical protein